MQSQDNIREKPIDVLRIEEVSHGQPDRSVTQESSQATMNPVILGGNRYKSVSIATKHHHRAQSISKALPVHANAFKPLPIQYKKKV